MPLYGPMFIPSLFVTPFVLLVAYVLRTRTESYPRFWWTAVVVCFLLTMYFAIAVLAMPLWSEQDHSPDNPGGFGKGSTTRELVPVLFFKLFLVVPSFPTLLGLAFLPPRNLPSKRQSVLIVFYVVVVSALIAQKHVRYMADYRRERAKPKQTPFERFEYLRKNAARDGE
jgi:hypothetical protein